MFGLGGYVLSIGLQQQYGTKLAGASLASLINVHEPDRYLLLCGALLLHERMTMKKVVCIVSAVAGASASSGETRMVVISRHSALSLGSVLTWER